MSKIKNKRLEIVRSLLNENKIHSQVELKDKLKECGINISQSTLSRDLKELGYIRAPIGDGTYRIIKVEGGEERLDLLFRLGLVKISYVNNIIVIKTKTGNAQAVCTAIDHARIDGIVGTLAGDDTIFALAKNKSVANRVVTELKKYIG
ncbi:MAG: arginine repressor [candidate division WOR-3 bacterium]|jgi:transcriptional regulator of arginine metabolism